MIDEIPMVRINSRIRVDQKKYLKELVKERNTDKPKDEKVGEAELHREMIDYYKSKHK